MPETTPEVRARIVAMVKAGASQSQAARYCGVSQTTVSAWMVGGWSQREKKKKKKKKPSTPMVNKIPGCSRAAAAETVKRDHCSRCRQPFEAVSRFRFLCNPCLRWANEQNF